MIAFQVTEKTPAIRFLASLSDGRTVIQDDRPGQPHAWHRLKTFMAEHPELRVTCLRLQGPGPGQEWIMPANQPGYVFGHKATLFFGIGQTSAVGIGYYDGTTCCITWLRDPELNASAAEQQDVGRCGFKLLRNPETAVLA